MKTHLLCGVVAVTAAIAASDVSAQTYVRGGCDACANGSCNGYGYGSGFGESYKQAYMQNIIWPKQYVQPARSGICQAFETMVNNGWRRHNLLGKYHFKDETAELTEAGKLKSKWILSHAPTHRRTVFVERGPDETVTSDRITRVQEYASTLSPNVSPADVQETHIVEMGRPAGAIDAMFTNFSANQAAPVLPQASASSED